MESHVSAENLSKAVSDLLGGCNKYLLNSPDVQHLMEDIAGVVCKHVGGAVVPARFADMPGQNVRIQNTDALHDRREFWDKFASASSASSNSRNSSRTLAELTLQFSRKDIFGDMIASKSVQLDGRPAVRVLYRADLVAQERISEAPKSTLIDEHLFQVRPDLYKACLAMNPGFQVDEWIGQRLEYFANEYARSHDPDSTLIVQLAARHGKALTLTLKDLWDARSVANGGWEIAGRTVTHSI